MDNEIPSVSFLRTWRGYEGHLTCAGDEISAVSHFSIRGAKYRPRENWSLDFSVPGDFNSVHARLEACNAADLHLSGTTFSGRSIKAHLLDIEPPTISIDTPPPEFDFRASANQIDVGLGRLPALPSEQRVAVVFSDHALSRSERRYLALHQDGRIASLVPEDDEHPEPEPLYWSTRCGRGELWLRYAWDQLSVGGREARVRIPELRFELEVPQGGRFQDVEMLVEEVYEDLQWLRRLLTLFSRQHVRCLEIGVFSKWGDGSPNEIRISRRAWSRSPSRRDELLDPVIMHPASLPADGLEQLKRRVNDLPFERSVSSAIGGLVESFRAEFVEGQWASAFTALETMVNAIGNAHDFTSPLGSGEFYRMKGKLEQVIAEYEPREGQLREVDRENLKRMLGALRRAPFSVRAAQAVSQMGVEWEDLWPPNTNLEEAIGVAYKRRSDLVHHGQIPDERAWFVDQFRMHALAERLVLATLEVPDDWLTASPYLHCAGLPAYPA